MFLWESEVIMVVGVESGKLRHGKGKGLAVKLSGNESKDNVIIMAHVILS